LIDAFLLHRRASGCSQKTLDWHETSLRKFQRWLPAENQDVATWNAILLRSYVVYLQNATTKYGKPLSGHSVTTYTSSLLAFLRWLHEEEMTPTNFALRIKKPREPELVKEAYSEDEVRRLFKAADTLRDHAMLCVLLDCGVRAAELTNLTTGDLVMDQRMLLVRSGKGRKDRVIPFSYPTAKALTRYLMKRPEQSEVLFPSEKGGKLLPNSVKQMVKRIAKRANVEGATVHRFRRTFATFYLRNGGDLMTLKTLMGHADLSTTSVYLHITNEDLQRNHSKASPLSNLKR
jgi:site-specific recombinase XerD